MHNAVAELAGTKGPDLVVVVDHMVWQEVLVGLLGRF